MSKLHLLGTGSGLLCPGRCASAYLLETEEGDVLFDAGEPVSITLRRKNYDWQRMKGIIISHTHPDHIGGLPLLIQQLQLSRRKEPVRLYAPEEYVERIYEHLNIHYLFPDYFSFELKPEKLTEDKIILNGTEILPMKTKHLDYIKKRISHKIPNKFEAFSFRIKTGKAYFLYSGDIKSFREIKKSLPGCSFAIIETTHIELDELLEWAEKNPCCNIIASHISPDFNLKEFQFKKEKKAINNISLAEEGSLIYL